MEKVICSPEDYYGSTFSKFVANELRAEKNSWIYDIIKSGVLSKHEQVFIDNKDWCFCVDKHHGHDLRYLVIFKNKNLKTIRDLRENHLAMLQEVYVTVSAWLSLRHTHRFFMYFHYMPSVFQLHMHVNSNTQHINWDRAHLLSTVSSNLRKDSEYYAKALILTKMCKTIRSANAHVKLKTKIQSICIHYKSNTINSMNCPKKSVSHV